MDSAWFVPASRLERLQGRRARPRHRRAGHRKLRKYPRGTFIYRLAGRDRQKSASYYTPQVLTQCLVKYALKELLEGQDRRRHPDPHGRASPPWAAPRS